MARRKTMSLEKFEEALGNRRSGGQVAGQGKWQRFIRDLKPCTPTRAVAIGDVRWMQTYLRRAWHGSKAVKYRMVDEKGNNILGSVDEEDYHASDDRLAP